jgi:hypothetical protein
MGYLHISNLYKNQTILMFKECFALEKIHGTSAHISWKFDTKEVNFFNGGENRDRFLALFNVEVLKDGFLELFPNSNAIVFGEAYGGKQQGMSHTYGKELKFIGFDVKVNDYWLEVPNAESVCLKLGLEFVNYVIASTDVEVLNSLRDAPSVQAVRNGILEPKKREGIVLRPLVEMFLKDGSRVICKHKADEFGEIKTARDVSPERLKVLEDAKEIAEEWVTEQRLNHVLQLFPEDVSIEKTGDIIQAMIEDVYREAKGEIVESKEANRAIGSKTVKLFKSKLSI